MRRPFERPSGVYATSLSNSGISNSGRNLATSDPDTRDVTHPKARFAAAILLVDDHPAVARSLEQLLLRYGLAAREVVRARTLEEGRAALRRSPRFAGFLLDWRLGPEVTVEPLLAEIRALYPRLSTPVFVPTGFIGCDDVVRRAQRHGADVLEKRSGDGWAGAARRFAESAASVAATERWLTERALPALLTLRERFVVTALLDGAARQSVADALEVTPRYLGRLERSIADKLRVEHLKEILLERSCI